jgi:hypothetical protein
MTEAEWLACTDPALMLGFVRNKACVRQLQRIAVAFCRRIWPLFSDQRCRYAVQVAEGFADGIFDERQLDAANKASYSVYENTSPPDSGFSDSAKGISRAAWEAAQAATIAALVFSTPRDGVWNCQAIAQQAALAASFSARESHPAGVVADYAAQAAEANERANQVDLLREIIGNPFRPVIVIPGWLAWNDRTVLKLAQAIYDDRAFDRLPVLADALEEAGCDNAEILNHCRQLGEHVRGCWLVDLIVGK